MINLLYDSYVRQEDDGIIEQILSDLTDYVFVHFKKEENHFTETGYADAQIHIAEHQFFLKKIKEFQAEYRHNEPAFLTDIIAFLQEWITTHIMHTDKKYMENFRMNGLK